MPFPDSLQAGPGVDGRGRADERTDRLAGLVGTDGVADIGRRARGAEDDGTDHAGGGDQRPTAVPTPDLAAHLDDAVRYVALAVDVGTGDVVGRRNGRARDRQLPAAGVPEH